MAQIAVNPFVLKNVLLTLGSDDYRKHVSSVEFVPTASSVVFNGLGNNTHTNVSTASWVANLSFAQDWETEDSLSRYLFENEGETVAALFEPVAGGSGFSANLVLTPGAIGGTVNATAIATVSLGSDKPVFVLAA